MRTTATTVVCLWLAGSAGVLDARQANEADAFRRRLLDAFTRGDRRAVAGMVRYRLVVDAGGLMIPVVDRDTLLQMWNVVFPPWCRRGLVTC